MDEKRTKNKVRGNASKLFQNNAHENSNARENNNARERLDKKEQHNQHEHAEAQEKHDNIEKYVGLNQKAVNLVKIMPKIGSSMLAITVAKKFSNIKTFAGSQKVLVDNFSMQANGRSDNCRIYYPKVIGQKKAIIFFHGGGFIYGGLNTNDGGLRDLCEKIGVIVISVDYSLSPNFPFPNAVNECVDVSRQIFDNAEALDIDRDNISLMGDSAGGNLSVAVAYRLSEFKNCKPAHLFLLYPYVDAMREGIEEIYPSIDKYGSGFFLEKTDLFTMTNCYIPEHVDRNDPMISVINGKVGSLPPTLVVVCGFDPLLDMGVAFYNKLKKAGVYTKLVMFEDIIHGYFSIFRDYALKTIEQIRIFVEEYQEFSKSRD